MIKNLSIENTLFSTDEQLEIQKLISSLHYQDLDLKNLFYLMDKVWDEMECDNRAINKEKLRNYYQHPIWILNGLFIENDSISLQHRNSIANWIANQQLRIVVDYGGGFGTLARKISDCAPEAEIDIFEPYPSQIALKYCQNHPTIHFVNQLESNYDCLVSTDVLEHVVDPLALLHQMISAVRLGGYLIIANHFYPSIKCHLPSTFHLRHTFDSFAQAMGLEKIGLCVGSHAIIYRKSSEQPPNWLKIRIMEAVSQLTFYWHNSSMKQKWQRVKNKLRILVKGSNTN